MAGGFIKRQVIASRGMRRTFAYSLSGELGTTDDTLSTNTQKESTMKIDLTRPEGCPQAWEAVVAIGYAPDGPWVIHVVKQPATTFAQAREYSPEALAVAVRWLPTAAWAEGFALHVEKSIMPPERGLFMRGFRFSMPREQLEKLFVDTAKALRAPELQLGAFV
ncbi:MAG: hypothetical protein AB7S74_07385 [Hyphomicrobium sp.]